MSLDAFTESWIATGKEEGEYSDNPHDAGGKTRWGITEQVARAHGYKGDMKDLPRDVARSIAKQQYWDLMRLDEIAALSRPIAKEMFDTGFNAGQATVVKFLQRLLNVLNRMEQDYPDITADGLMGKISVASLRAFLAKRGTQGELVMLRGLNCLQGEYYVDITEGRKQNESFVFGWLSQRVSI